MRCLIPLSLDPIRISSVSSISSTRITIAQVRYRQSNLKLTVILCTYMHLDAAQCITVVQEG